MLKITLKKNQLLEFAFDCNSSSNLEVCIQLKKQNDSVNCKKGREKYWMKKKKYRSVD